MNPLLVFAPFLSVSAGIILVMGASIARWSRTAIIATISVLLSLGWVLSLIAGPISFQAWGISFDTFGTLGSQIILPIVLSISFLCYKTHPQERLVSSLLLILLSSIGALSVLLAHNWMVLFLGIQCMSLPIYGLIARDSLQVKALSASLRYLILSALAMAFMLFGILLLYADTQSFDFYIQSQLWQNSPVSSLSSLGLLLVFIGICFKLSVFPFHIWTPDVYEGAPSYVVGLMLLVVKTVVLITLIRFSSIIGLSSIFYFLSALAFISLILGNGVLLIEKNFYRLLAFFSIGHMGLLIGVLLTQSQLGTQALFMDLFAFSLSIIVILATLSSLSFLNNTVDQSHFDGLFYRHPLHAITIAVAFLSMVGFPLTAGFVGKYSIILALIESKSWVFVAGLIIASIFMVIAFAQLLVRFFKPAEHQENLVFSKLALVTLVLLLVLGFYPQPFLQWIQLHLS